MNRREFIATAAVASTGPILLGVTKKAEEKKPVIGVEGHKYECVHNWGELPGEFEWQTTHNVALDGAGNVYITHQGLKNKKGMDTVFVFDPKGKYIRSFGKDWHEGGHGIEIRKEGSEEFIYFSNTWTKTKKLVKTNLKGEQVWEKGRPECPEYAPRPDAKDATKTVTPAYNPTNICWLPDGGFNVGDGYGSNYMLNYDKDGKLVKVFGGSGKGEGQLQTPHGQWVDDRVKDKPVLVVCDRANARLSRFRLDGTPIDSTAPGQVVLFPAHAKTRGDVLLVPDLHARVSLFDKENKPIVHLGDDAEWRKKVLDGFKVRSQPKEWLPGKFVHPHDAAFDKDGNIFVVEWVSTGRITLLKKVG
ncbi:Twin-arginine translocation pathway signal OS=Planctomyces maris DSM 8797 GN=PM8797T_08504 PE=4 SV=1 [Gemmata massiliana]|uniref:Twin-arginine translocation pathway signal n=1 Tax=Gemmata massiliana TaxID=1210884 RepID=A0A6P2DBC0_9BACT|nr:peptidase [Gemmata massiliana]VTR98446.1 Twin-arginine translocation pathway signal OS=Planctomyces maris DSM 8797 GN=PM8797T_08504 PE=4 SV=1 [Gemmata massiliana]